MTAVISRDTINIDNPSYVAIASERINMFGTGFISVGALVALIVLIIAIIVLNIQNLVELYLQLVVMKILHP